ncbi:unnamed protein product [Ilex paraguariensis]|uniref:Uncharacterized protein n=1 Tax=Ilex paraguariensis TaxID=185542 RepID=A0ABC8SY23_9AQUA
MSYADGPLYDSSAYTECKVHAEEPLYNGGVLKDHQVSTMAVEDNNGTRIYSPAFLLHNLIQGTIYCFSS